MWCQHFSINSYSNTRDFWYSYGQAITQRSHGRWFADKDNIKYFVKPCPSLGEIFSPLADELVKERSKMPKSSFVLLHTEVYTELRRKLGQNITDPVSLPNLLGVWVADLFTTASKPEMKELVLKEFCEADASQRLVVNRCIFCFWTWYGLPRYFTGHPLGMHQRPGSRI